MNKEETAMAKYIDVDALKKEIDGKNRPEINDGSDEVECLCKCIRTAPAVDVAPVKNGKWVHLGGGEWCCSCCGFVIGTDGSWEHPMGETRCNDYCCKCGAKMEGANENYTDNAKTS